MKIECENNKVYFENKGSKKEIHPFWLRERANGDSFVDKNTQQDYLIQLNFKKTFKLDH